MGWRWEQQEVGILFGARGGSHFALGQDCCNTSRLSAGHLYVRGSFLTQPSLQRAHTQTCTHGEAEKQMDRQTKKDIWWQVMSPSAQTTARFQSNIAAALDQWHQYDLWNKDKNKVWKTKVVRSSETRTDRRSVQPLHHSEACHWIKVAHSLICK